MYESNVIGIFFSRNGGEGTGMVGIQSMSESNQKFMGDFEPSTSKKFFLGKFGKVAEIWNKIDADVIKKTCMKTTQNVY